MLIENDIRRLRFENGEMTQAALAERIGMTRQSVIAIEQNKYAPSLEAAFRIANVFGVSSDQAFRWTRGRSLVVRRQRLMRLGVVMEHVVLIARIERLAAHDTMFPERIEAFHVR